MSRRKQARKKGAKKRSGRSSKPASQREPWTPWGKWAKARRERIEQRRKERENRRKQRRRKREKRRLRRRLLATRGIVFLGLVGLTCGIGLFVLLFLGRPYPWEAVRDVIELMQLSQALSERRERWESLAIHHYTIEVAYMEGQTRCGPVMLEVRNGQVVDPPGPDRLHWFPAEVCDALLTSLTVEGAFERLDRQLSQFQPGESYLQATFDPGFGYLTDIEVGIYSYERLPGCCWSVTWRNLRLLTD